MPSPPALSWYRVPENIKHLLVQAANHWEDTEVSEGYINQALAEPDATLDVLVTAYRYFFYKNNNAAALRMADQVIDRVKTTAQLPDDWGQLIQSLETRKDEPDIRLYLNAYAASGLMLARLGELEKARHISAMITEIDTRNEFGASTILNILTRPPDEDEDDL
jgi:hypothetical protein